MQTPFFGFGRAPWRRRLGALVLVAASPLPAWAGPGHDHSHDDAPAAIGPALPRFAATSELFELVGVLDGRKLTLFLDHAESNEPVVDGTLELEVAGQKVEVTRVAPGAAAAAGDFEVLLPQALPEGVHPVTAMVTTPKDADLLAGELDIHAAGEAAHDHGGWWGELVAHAPRSALWGGAAVLLAAAVAVALRRRARTAASVGGAA
jgi:hypothetical protein